MDQTKEELAQHALSAVPPRPAWIEIDLKQLKHNFQLIMQDKPEGLQIVSVVKDEGYGHGLFQVAQTALDCGATLLGLVTLDEAAALRERNIKAPVLLLACAHKEYTPIAALNVPRASLLAVHGSIFPAIQNILLACRALGVGATLTTLHSFFEDTLKAKLGIPDKMEVAAMIPMGYPRGKFGPVSRNPVEEVIHWDRWGNQKS